MVPSGSASEKTFVAHRVQIKLGKSLIALGSENLPNVVETADIIAKMFVDRLDVTKTAYTRGCIPLSDMKLYIATTRRITPDARKHFEDHGIIVLDSRWLFDNVWPVEGRELISSL